MEKYFYSPSQVSLNSPTETDFDGNKSDATATKVKLNERLGLDDKVRNLKYASQLHVLQLIYKFFSRECIFTCCHIFMLSKVHVLLSFIYMPPFVII